MFYCLAQNLMEINARMNQPSWPKVGNPGGRRTLFGAASSSSSGISQTLVKPTTRSSELQSHSKGSASVNGTASVSGSSTSGYSSAPNTPTTSVTSHSVSVGRGRSLSGGSSHSHVPAPGQQQPTPTDSLAQSVPANQPGTKTEPSTGQTLARRRGVKRTLGDLARNAPGPRYAAGSYYPGFAYTQPEEAGVPTPPSSVRRGPPVLASSSLGRNPPSAIVYAPPGTAVDPIPVPLQGVQPPANKKARSAWPSAAME